MRLVVGSRTDIGRVRKRNEDSMLVRAPLFVVADGMGGHRGGNVASKMSVDAIEAAPVGTGGTHAVVEAIRTANRSVLERGDAEPDLSGMGTTVTALLVDGDRGHIAHVGDSRAYLFRASTLEQITEDHTVVQELVRQGRLSPQDAERHPQRSILTRALGVDDHVDVDELTLALEPGDRVLMCSDGLSGFLSADGIALVLGTTPDPQDAADRLVALANEAGGDDNITVIVVDAHADDGAQTAPGTRTAASGEGDPNQTASMPAITLGEGATATAAVAPAPRPRSPEAGRPRRPGRARRRVAALLVILLLAGGATAFFGVRAFLNGQWYVGTAGGRVAVFNGIPARVLGVHLAHVELVTSLDATEAGRLQTWRTLPQGIVARSKADADALVEQIRQDLCRSPTSTCVPGSAT